jgi:alpha-tubulin suppressor-like RCC1 family protein
MASGVAEVTVGATHSCLRTSKNAGYCWGQGLDGRLGTGNTTSVKVPTLITALSASTTAIEAGDSHTCAIKSGGATYCWGDNLQGQLGVGDYLDRNVPTLTKNYSGASQISAGAFQTCARKSGGVHCWGLNSQAQLGNGSSDGKEEQAVPVTGMSLGSFVATGSSTSCGVTGGVVKCWGNGNDGEIGDGRGLERSVPTSVIGG